MKYRIEHDSMGEVKVPDNHYWGAQTQRSLEHFAIGNEKIPKEVIYALAIIKKAAAITNKNLGRLDEERCSYISKVCDEISKNKLIKEFPLSVWQTGSGTQTNMNLNEVIANRGNELAKQPLLHPNDHCNMSQSSNDTFPTAMHIAAVKTISEKLIPAIESLSHTFEKLMDENKDVIKMGRTHLQDATPILFSQEISGWKNMLDKSKTMIISSLNPLSELALGGTAVGTGLNAPQGFDKEVARNISEITGYHFTTAENKFHSLTSKDELVFAHGALKALAANMMKIANDIRWLSSGPRCGIGEIEIPENEPGSSIMPGKVNPTQCEALSMVAVQVMANDTAIGFSASQGNFELNVFMPVCIYNFIQSVNLLSDSILSFNKHCAQGIKPNLKKMQDNVNNSLMLVTCLNSHIGYENAANVAKKAYKENLSLKESCLALGFLDSEEFDKLVVPRKMV